MKNGYWSKDWQHWDICDVYANIGKKSTALIPEKNLGVPVPLRVCFPVLLDGDIVMSTEHLGPAYLTAILRKANAECRIFDVPIVNEKKEIIDEIIAWKPDIIGISLTTISIDHAVSFGRTIRDSLGNKVFILAGGPLATNLGENLLELKDWEFLDALVRGEGEIPMLRLAEAIHTKESFSKIPNLVYRTPNSIVHNKVGPVLHDLDLLPEPARDQFENHPQKLPYLRISTSRGCTSHCTFCNAPNAKNRLGPGKIWRGRSPEKVVDEIQNLYLKYKCDTFDFVDSTFEDPGGTPAAKERIGKIAEEILKRKMRIYYNCCFQAKNWSKDDLPLLDLLFKSGLEKVLVGIESGSEIGLRRWQKLSSTEDNKRVIKLLREKNIYLAFGFISFHPWSTFEEIDQNNTFLRYQMGHNLRRYTVRLELYPGASVVEQLRAGDLLLPDYDTTLNPMAYKYKDKRVELLASALNGLYGHQYEESCIIKKEPAVFKFETYDIVLHTYRSRIARFLDHNEAGSGILKQCDEEIEIIKKEMAEFNYSLVSEFVDLAEREKLLKEMGWKKSEIVEQYYQKKMSAIQSSQLRASMKLHRAGYSVRSMLRPISSVRG